MGNIIETIFKLLAIFTILFLVGFLLKAATGGGHHAVPLQKADINIGSKASLQRGYKYATNYCLSCHAASYSRYNRVGRDLGISDNQLRENLIFTSNERGEKSKVGDLMKVAMSKTYAKEAFGTVPPDLSLLTRSRGVDWIYTYLKSFYKDDSRPFGVNNLVFPDVGMPHVLSELQGLQEKTTHVEDDGHGKKHETVSLELSGQGSLTPAEYDEVVRDITNFMSYLAEPVQQQRKTLGLFVLLFLAVFFVVAYFLKKEYWKDVH